jgi:hypothetical protein
MGDVPQRSWIKPRTWRVGGGVCIAAAAFMAWYGAQHLAEVPAARAFWVGYWIIFLLFMAAALYAAFLDLAYARLQFRLAEREAFQNTLGSEEFRQALRRAQEDEAAKRKP